MAWGARPGLGQQLLAHELGHPERLGRVGDDVGWEEGRALGEPVDQKCGQCVHALAGAGRDGEILHVGQLVGCRESIDSRLGLGQALHHLGVVGLVDLVHHDDETRGLGRALVVVFVFVEGVAHRGSVGRLVVLGLGARRAGRASAADAAVIRWT